MKKPNGVCERGIEIDIVDSLSAERNITQDEIDRDINYRKAQNVASAMLTQGLISLDEFNKLNQLNRETFSPYLVEIMPKIC